MRLEVKSTIILLVTLALGAALGVVGGGLWQQVRVGEAQALRRPQGFVAHLEDVIRPTAEQRDRVRAILDSTARMNDAILREAQADLRQALDSMRTRLAPLLDSAQQARLADESNFPNPIRAPRGDGPPPGAGGRPPRGAGPRGDRSPPPRDGRPRDGPPPPAPR